MSVIEQLLERASQLPADQRVTLAHRLLASTEPAPSTDIERAWDSEIRRRIERYDAGKEPLRDAGEVFAELDHRLRA